jgi:hypothetical protein
LSNVKIPITNKTITNGKIAVETPTNGTIKNGINGGTIANGTFINGTNPDGSITSFTYKSGTIIEGVVIDGLVIDGILKNGNFTDGTVTYGNIIDATINDGIMAYGNVNDGIISNGQIIDGIITNGYLKKGDNITYFYLSTDLSNETINFINFTNTFNVNVNVVETFASPNDFNNYLKINIPIGIGYSGSIECSDGTSIQILTTINSLYYDVYANGILIDTITGVSTNTINSVSTKYMKTVSNSITYSTGGTKQISMKQYLNNFYGESTKKFTKTNALSSYMIDIYCRANVTQTIRQNTNNLGSQYTQNRQNLGTLCVNIIPSIIVNISDGNIINNSDDRDNWINTTNSGYTKFVITDG